VLAFAVALVLSAEDGRGAELTTSEEVRAQRQEVRPHLDASVGFGLGLGRYLLLGAAGHLEAGIVVADRHIISVRLSAASMLISNVAHGGLSFGEAIGDRVTLSLGAAFAMLLGPGEPGLTIGAQFPVRATVLLSPARSVAVRRSGLILGLEGAPGFTQLTTAFAGQLTMRLAPTFTAALTLGWATW
jgi:hypothetical protein